MPLCRRRVTGSPHADRVQPRGLGGLVAGGASQPPDQQALQPMAPLTESFIRKGSGSLVFFSR